MRVAILTGSVSRQAGGVFEALVGLSQALHKLPRIELHVIGLQDAGTEADAGAWTPVPVTAAAVRGPRAFGFSAAFRPILARLRPDIVHVHGLWMYASVAALLWGARTGVACVVSPHGMLDPWALGNSNWKKRIAGALYETRHLRRAACLHAVGDSEHAAIRALGLHNPVCVIPNGITLPHLAPPAPVWHGCLPPGARVLLYLGRLHPKKGLATLLRAWDSVHRSVPAAQPWHLVIAGWDQGGHRADLEALVQETGAASTVHFIGPQFAAAKDATFAAADAFVLPSLSEGLPVAVLEAWSHGLPVLMTTQCNLPEGYAAGAALQMEPDTHDIAAQLRRLVLMAEAERHAMGASGRSLVMDRFAWPTLADQMASVYRWLLCRGPPPNCVRMLGQGCRA
ncbi:MAG: glycosyltransferase [Acetobacteraceae bacterium]|nr:glycosyltransferase [Acetobacteraceae bacterium]